MSKTRKQSSAAAEALKAVESIGSIVSRLESAKNSLLEEQRELARECRQAIDEVEKKFNGLQDEIDREIAEIDKALDRLGVEVVRFKRGQRMIEGKPISARGKGAALSAKDAIVKVLSGAGGPRDVDTIMTMMRDAGWRTGASNPRAIVSQALGQLKKAGRLSNPSRGKYALRK